MDGPLSSSLRTRLPWLTVNLGTTFLAAATIALFESTPDPGGRARRRSCPWSRARAESAGTQTLTLIVPRNRARPSSSASPRTGSWSAKPSSGPSTGSGWASWSRSSPFSGSRTPDSAWCWAWRCWATCLSRAPWARRCRSFLRRIGSDPAVASAVVVDHLHGRLRLPAVSRHRERVDRHDHVAGQPADRLVGLSPAAGGAFATFCGRPSRNAITLDTAPSLSKLHALRRLVGEVPASSRSARRPSTGSSRRQRLLVEDVETGAREVAPSRAPRSAPPCRSARRGRR